MRIPPRYLLAGTALLAALLTVAVASPPGVTNPIPGDPVAIAAGKVSGTLLASGVHAYFGIPFAAPPIRGNRWRAPQPVQPWSGVYTADRMPPECVQPLRSRTINHYFGDELAGEDCLYLNIWAPPTVKHGGKLPVVVWIYGGAFNIGSASSAIYGGEELAQKGVIYVAPNYRLGIFGFLADPELTQESGHHASGNWGFLDQVAALQWVRRNIAAFGGDPANVTLIGQSAGSMSLSDLQASPLAKGLFTRLIGLSGTVWGGLGAGVPLAQAEAQGVKLQKALNAANLAAMRGFSSDKVAAAAQAAGVRAGPDIDGYFLPDTVPHIFAAHQQTDAALITGSTANDIGTAIPIRQATTVAAYEAAVRQEFGASADEFLQLFPVHNDGDVHREAELVGRDSGMGTDARAWVQAQATNGEQPAYLYILSRVQPFAPGVAYSDFNPATAGAYHMGDVPYWLGTYNAFNLFRVTRNWTAWDRKLSDAMQNIIVSFAKTGNPSTAQVTFPRYTPQNEVRLDFGNSITVDHLDAAQMNFLAAHPPARGARGGRGGRGRSGAARGGPSPPMY